LIKINLLPVARATKKVALNDVQYQLAAGLAVIFVLVAVCGYRWQMLSEQVLQQTHVKESKQKELVDLKKKVIEQLRKDQGGPVRLLDHVSQSLDPLKIWLTNVEQGSAQIVLDGRALSTDDVVEFVKSLQRSNYFSSVLLEESRQATEEGLAIYQFRLKMTPKG